jgi:hypothetical protein
MQQWLWPDGPLAWRVQLALPALAGRREKGVSQRTWDLEAAVIPETHC